MWYFIAHGAPDSLDNGGVGMPIIPSGVVDIPFCALLYGSGDPYFGPELSFCISTMSFSLLYPHFPIDLPLSHLNPALVARVLIPSPRASHFRFLFYCCLLQITLSTTLFLALELSMVFSYKISPPPPGPSFTRTIFCRYDCSLQITLSTTFSLAVVPSIVFFYKISLPPPGPSFHIETLPSN